MDETVVLFHFELNVCKRTQKYYSSALKPGSSSVTITGLGPCILTLYNLLLSLHSAWCSPACHCVIMTLSFFVC